MALEITGLGVNANNTTGKTNKATGSSSFSDVLVSTSANASAASKTDLDRIFEAASERYGVPVSLLKAVAKAESNFNPKVVSSCGAVGIMQLMPGTAKALGVTNSYDPEQNIMGGAKYLSQLLKQFDGNTKFAVAAYNAGPNNVLKYDGIPPFHETQNYVAKVMAYLDDNIQAGSVPAAGNIITAGISAVPKISIPSLPDMDLPPAIAASEYTHMGTMLEGALLSGSLDGDLTSLIGSLSSASTTDLSSQIMTSVYQLQLKMMQGDDKEGGNVIV